MERYARNLHMLSAEENESLKSFKVVVVGCGGLGGYLIEMLARLGIGQITMVDGDVFETSNLNRQLLSTPKNIGTPKASEALKRVSLINPEVNAIAVNELLTLENANGILNGHHVVLDALDNLQTRRIIESEAEKLQIPMVMGAIAGWYAQVCTIFPGDRMIDRIYPEEMNKGAETHLGNPSFTPALAAAIQVAEALKVLLGRGELLRGKVLSVNLLEQNFQVIEL